jgi:hypothetical protein
MSRRTIVLFWGATAAAVFFLGSAWAAAGGPSAADMAVFAVSILGFLATASVTGRIAFVVARLQRRSRRIPR